MNASETNRDIKELTELLNGLFERPMQKELAPQLGDIKKDLKKNLQFIEDLRESLEEQSGTFKRLAGAAQTRDEAVSSKLDTLSSMLDLIEQAVAVSHAEQRAFAADFREQLRAAAAFASEQSDASRLLGQKQARATALWVGGGSLIVTTVLLLIELLVHAH